MADGWDATVQGALAGVVLLGPAMPWLWRAPGVADLGLGALYAAAQTTALLRIAGAVRRAEVSGRAPRHYSRIVFALGFDALLFTRLPGAWAIAGRALIAAGGLVLAWPRRQGARPAAPTAGTNPRRGRGCWRCRPRSRPSRRH